MKQLIFAALLLTIVVNAHSQAPFTTTVKEPRFLEEKNNLDDTPKLVAVTDTNVVKNLIDNPTSEVNKAIIKSTKNDIDFFKNNGLTLNLINQGENRLSVNTQVLHYKLYIANPNEKNKYRVNRYNLPLLVVTKLSSSYDSLNAASALDVLDYEAAPITLRLMPSFKKSFKTYNDVIYYGLYVDARGLNLHSPESNSYTMEFIASGGIGVTYQGDGSAGSYNPNGEYESGRYSLSLVLQGAAGKQEVLSRLFNTHGKNYIGSLQAYFIFKVSDESRLNIKMGFQHYFQRTIGGALNNFSLSLGI